MNYRYRSGFVVLVAILSLLLAACNSDAGQVGTPIDTLPPLVAVCDDQVPYWLLEYDRTYRGRAHVFSGIMRMSDEEVLAECGE